MGHMRTWHVLTDDSAKTNTGDTMTTERYASVRTLTGFAIAGADGKDWYATQARFLAGVADAADWDLDLFLDVIALTSPRQSVAGNLRLARGIMGELDRGVTLHVAASTAPGLMCSIRASIRHYAATNEIRGPKTSRFALNLKGDESVATLDVHMAYALGLSRGQRTWLARNLSGKRYLKLQSRIQKVARDLGWTTAQTQAAIWTAVTREKGIRTGVFSA